MKTTTVHLPDEATLALEQLALQTGRSQAELIQEAIADYLSRKRQSLPSSIGMGASGRSDLSERDEELLWQDA
ncbi:MAG: ribbon-helix-helix protein, CopG family [Leptolyngbyaceae cyanobacterium SM1_4_3]|nr:ribbon-helix-helix protein, CopG family [Leptolyngbyaceae cyanobacterium SM1_4_3]